MLANAIATIYLTPFNYYGIYDPMYQYYVVSHTVPLILYCILVVSPGIFMSMVLTRGTVIIKSIEGLAIVLVRTVADLFRKEDKH